MKSLWLKRRLVQKALWCPGFVVQRGSRGSGVKRLCCETLQEKAVSTKQMPMGTKARDAKRYHKKLVNAKGGFTFYIHTVFPLV